MLTHHHILPQIRTPILPKTTTPPYIYHKQTHQLNGRLPAPD